ncbi:hypothetical protein [Spirochaeta cellobiosiphila]|uniref:hypothetical protein n=1 Tax=Spirochaeta cellobiosiphila TaxID=504483 RepID=UPI0004124470|nr:hypothetical protein [Spirochaeta cellobiosiphila]
MNKDEITKYLNNSKLDLDEVWIICGAAMVLHDLRESTSDIDLGCKKEYFEKLITNNKNIKTWPDGMRSIDFDENIEIFEEWNIKENNQISGVKVSSLKDLLNQKKGLNREKDKFDIKILEEKIKEKRIDI